jgi:regulator of sigma D
MKFLESLERASKSFKTAEHLVYVTIPLVKEQRLLLKALEEVYDSLFYCLNAILQFEYFMKRILLYPSANENFKIFKEKLAKDYGLSDEQVDRILEIFSLMSKHRKSNLEFVKKDKIVIINNSVVESFDMNKMIVYLSLARHLLDKARGRILS